MDGDLSEPGSGSSNRDKGQVTNQKSTIGLTAAFSAGGREVLPEKGVVDVSAAVEVKEGGDGGSLGEVSLALGLGNGLECGVEAGHVGLVVLLVVKLHDLARDVGLESSIIVCTEARVSQLSLV